MDNNNNPSPNMSVLNREDLGGTKKKKRSRSWMTADPMEYAQLKENAINNRKNMTEAESVFWSMVQGSALGERCLRQHIIGCYIVDFLFRKSKVVVELDGGYHFTEEQQKEDAVRQDWLEQQGFKVVRFTNEQVLFDTDNTLTEIKKHLI